MSPASKTNVRVSTQVEAFVKALAPEPRRALRAAIQALGQDQGDRLPLEGDLASWYRLRTSSFRVLYRETWSRGIRTIDCVYVNRRATVYDLFRELVRNQLVENQTPDR